MKGDALDIKNIAAKAVAEACKDEIENLFHSAAEDILSNHDFEATLAKFKADFKKMSDLVYRYPSDTRPVVYSYTVQQGSLFWLVFTDGGN